MDTVPLVLAVVAALLFALDLVLWHTVQSYRTRTVSSLAGVALSVAVILLVL